MKPEGCGFTPETFTNLQDQGLKNCHWLRLIKEIKYLWCNRDVGCKTFRQIHLEWREMAVLGAGSSGRRGGKCLLWCSVKVSCVLPALVAETVVPKWIVSLCDLEMTVMSEWCSCWSLCKRCTGAIARELLVVVESSLLYSVPSLYL